VTAQDTSDEWARNEYFKLVDIVQAFDQRLLTIKGWGVTLSLAAVTGGFQYRAVGFFLVAALSGLTFWIIEWVTKLHQMRYYARMREIEVRRAELTVDPQAIQSPRIDWSWNNPPGRGTDVAAASASPRPFEAASPWEALFYPHVCLPHVLSVAAGALLVALGIDGLVALRLLEPLAPGR
jgi:hypothetical protein